MSNKTLIVTISALFFLKIIAIYFTNFNLFGDEAQYWLWSKDLSLGYFSKPPLLAWFINIHTTAFGNTFVSLKIFPSIIYFFMCFAIYGLCKNIGLKKNISFYCSVLFLIIPAVSFSSFVVSTDLLLLLFWTLSLNVLLKIKKNPTTINFLLLGLMLGLAFLSKYAAIYFLICFFIYLLIDKEIRSVISKNYLGFILCFISMIIIVLPNIIWNINNGWVTFQHTADNANFKNFDLDVLRGLSFLVVQVLMVGPFLFFGFIHNYKYFKANSENKFLLIFSLPIFIIVFIEAVIVRAHANWAAPALITFFLFLITNIVKHRSFHLRLNLFFNTIFCLLFFVLIAISYPADIFKRISGINNFANEVYALGSQASIKDFVVSDRLLYSSISYELRDKKARFHMPHKMNGKITNHFKITSPLKRNMNVNFILIGGPSDIEYLSKNYTINKRLSANIDFLNKEISVYEIIFN